MLPAATDPVGPPAGSVGEPHTEPAAVPIRPMQFRELLDLPFALIQTRIKTLAVLLGTAVAVAAAVTLAVTVLVSIATDDSDGGTFWGALLTGLAAAWALRMFVRGVTVPIGLAVVHRQQLSWRGALHQLASEAGPLLGYQVMYTLIGIGVLALGAPLLITFPFAAIWLLWLRARRFTTVPAIFDESATFRIATLRTKLLMSGSDWQIVGLLISLRGLLLVLVVPLLALPQFISGFSGTHRWTVTVLIVTVALLMVAFGEMVESAAQVVTYVDRRCRREAWDIRIPGAVRP
ncbi:hypothetical protein [Nocardia sp. NBC_01327]|uniref:hypothetical protein n=1 Tax=Nocardia sp. NBC_01327 TaxID=2903593 RepID=UPI002E142A36|nr:hypothetical protein OG326_02395 [Nocardia sp. NBC_01327]